MSDEGSPLPPHDLSAEEALLGACMLQRNAVEHAVEMLSYRDFYKPFHASVFAAIERQYHRVQPVDPVTLAGVLTDVPKAELLRIQAATPASANFGAYARRVAECAYLRRVASFGWELSQTALEGSPERTAAVLDSALDGSRLATPIEAVEPGVDFNDLVRREYSTDFLIPRLLERGDRIVLTGGEGKGKTTFSRQWAVTCAAGLHPLGFSAIEPLRVLHFDLQERESQSHEQYDWIRRRSGVRVKDGQLRIVHRRQGMNLLASADRRWFEAHLRQHRPDLVIIGPVYKAWSAVDGMTKHSEECVERFHGVIDRITERYDCAFLIEAHSPHGAGGDRADWRPYGASAWLRWSEFGIALSDDGQRGVKLKHWRGERPRDRDWPEVLVYGKSWPLATLAGEGETLL